MLLGGGAASWWSTSLSGGIPCYAAIYREIREMHRTPRPTNRQKTALCRQSRAKFPALRTGNLLPGSGNFFAKNREAAEEGRVGEFGTE
jgi:hypothetical protein